MLIVSLVSVVYLVIHMQFSILPEMTRTMVGNSSKLLM